MNRSPADAALTLLYPTLLATTREKTAHFNCPLCGSSIAESSETVTQRDYFYMLENLWRNYWHHYRSRTAERAGGTRNVNQISKSIAENAEGYMPKLCLPLPTADASISHIGTFDEGNIPYEQRDTASPIILGAADGNVTNSRGNIDWDSAGSIEEAMLVTGYYSRFFNEIRRLGAGSYGTVYLCEHHFADECMGIFAVKKIPIGVSRLFLTETLREVKLREIVKHGNLIEYKHSWLEAVGSYDPMPWLFILMEYCNAGELEDVRREIPFFSQSDNFVAKVLNQKVKLREVDEELTFGEIIIWNIFKDVCEGLDHLHRNLILHRDLKANNVMMDVKKLPPIPKGVDSGGPIVPPPDCHTLSIGPGADPEFRVRCLIADFGTAVTATERRTSSGFSATIEYTAPEVLGGSLSFTDPNFSRQHCKQSELWSLGCLLYLLLMGELPWDILESAQEAQKEILGKIRGWAAQGYDHVPLNHKLMDSKGIGTTIRVLLNSLLRFDPTKRPSCRDILNTPFLAPYWGASSAVIYHDVFGKILWANVLEKSKGKK